MNQVKINIKVYKFSDIYKTTNFVKQACEIGFNRFLFNI